MITKEDNDSIKHYLAGQKAVTISYPHSKTLAVYSLEETPFAYLETGKQLLWLSLRSDPQLSKVLRERYEEVSPGHKLNKKLWNTITVSGQLSVAEIKALIDHSYQLAKDINRSNHSAS